ncbi:ADP-ribosylation factor-like protein 8 [Nematocida sp. LUAm3]|nr:ADP-ribosylation factor-like protein 8 [Nematocida sp. LUAm3]KAI5176266.1 ADP-ribosylation factor-like protein 8 [Nematocida sp. LUAm2]KAI5176724.1 ADP-ribosylation factor-like protein 8 [Nematocida sp. LUAm1]
MQIKKCLEEIKNYFHYYFWNKKIKICVAGAKKSGKTSFCKAFTNQSVLKKEKPTKGRNIRKFLKKGIQGTLYDIGGAPEYANVTDLSYRSADVLFFVVDASSPELFQDAKEILGAILYRNKHRKAPVLVLCTHNDLSDSKTCQDIALELSLDSYLGRDLSCYSVSSLTLSNFTSVEEWIYRHAK